MYVRFYGEKKWNTIKIPLKGNLEPNSLVYQKTNDFSKKAL